MTLPRIINKDFDNGLTNFPHLVERTQLITIITFGEVVIASIKTFPLMENLGTGIFSFVAMAFIFIAYISQTTLAMDHHSKRRSMLLVYLHLIIIITVNLFTAGIEMLGHAGKHETQHTAEHGAEHGSAAFTNVLEMIVIGIVIFYICLCGLSVYNKNNAYLTKVEIAQYVIFTLIMVVLVFGVPQRLEIILIILAIYTYSMARVGFRFREKYLSNELES